MSRKRGLPSWLPVAALLAAFAVVAIALLASGGDDPAPRQSAGGGESAREAQPQTEEQPAQPTEEQPAEPAPEEQPAGSGGGNDPAEGARLDAQAYSLIQQGKYQEAVPIARRAVASFPEEDTSTNYAFALFNLGTALNRSGSPEEAIPLFEKRLSFSDNQRDVVEAELADARENAG